MSEVTSLRVHVGVLLVAPRVDKVTHHEGNARVWQLLASTAETVEEVALHHTSERLLLERRNRCST